MPRKKAADATAAAEKTTKAKATAAKATDTKAEVKKTRKAPCKTSVCVEMSGLNVSVDDIQKAVKQAVKDKGLDASDLKIYVNAAEQAAYYTVDGEGGDEYKIDLKSLN